jgi:hypothetical protein
MVMEYVAGVPFRDLMRLPPIVVARAVAEAARGLHAAHEVRDLAGHQMGLVHRDISPDNLMLGFDGHVKVIDFGIALIKNRQAPVTEFGTVKGKPPYMSPEQVKNEAMDRRSDVFSLAVVAWEMLTGRNLFEGDSIYAIAIAVEQQLIAPPSKRLGAALPNGLDAAIMTALDRDPARRTPTAAAFAEQLEQVVQAAGGESLEAWAERELDARRAQHRAWLAQITTGSTQLAKAVGRASGQVTELGPLAVANADAAPIPVVGSAAAPAADTSIGGVDGLERPARRRLAPLVLLLLAALVAAIAVYVITTREHATTPPPKPPADAAIAHDTPLIVTPSPLDAELEIDAAPVPVDAGRVAHADARVHVHVDATVVAKPDAPAAPTGTGIVTARSLALPYNNISIDGGNPVSPPLNNRHLPAGKHTIRWHDAKSGEVVHTEVIELKDGDSVVVKF